MATLSVSEFREAAQRDVTGDQQWLYRGVPTTAWKLESSFSRFCVRNGIPFSLDTFLQSLSTFTTRAGIFLGEPIDRLNLAERAALGQHHGLPTPLLDWTESPYVALFFSLFYRVQLPDLTGPVRVWAIRKEALRAHALDLEDQWTAAPTDCIVHVQPTVFQSRRLSRQFGSFTLQTSDVPLDQRPGIGGLLIKYDVDGSKPADGLEELRLMGLSASNLLDDLSGVAADTALQSLRLHRRPGDRVKTLV